MGQTSLNEAEKRYLLALARRTIEEALGAATTPLPPEPPSERLHAPGASFVTLHTRPGRQLRGCIGSLKAYRPLVEDVRENALSAAFRDPRFPPLRREELPHIVIEVSVLTRPEPLTYSGPEELVRKLRPGVDGVVIERGWRRATFLPQVWESLPQLEAFLANLCHKANLPPNAWHWPDLKVYTYQVEKFEEEV